MTGASGLVMIVLAVSTCCFIVTSATALVVDGEEDGTPPHTQAASDMGVTLVGVTAGVAESGRSLLRRDSADSKHSDDTGRMFRRCEERRGGMMSSKRTHGTRELDE